MNKTGTVIINFTIGFGNNLFQYAYGRLLAERNNMKLNHRAIPEINISESNTLVDTSLPTFFASEENYKKLLFADNFSSDRNIVVNGYFEDFTLYESYLQEIRSWFPKIQKTNHSDLILHMRLQNRLIQENHHKNHISPQGYIKGIEKFDFERIHIVTDAEKWNHYDESDIEKIRYHVKNGPNPPSNSSWVSVERSMDYMNSLIDGFAKYEPIVHCNGAKMIKGSGGLRGGFIDDFNLISSFNKIMLYNSTFSWWAALLSDASKIGVFGPWKPRKHNCRNLGKTNYPGWFSWGTVEDLYWNV